MGAANSNDRFNGARKLLDYGFANYTNIEVTAPEEELQPIKVEGGTANSVMPQCNESKGFLIEKSKAKTLTFETELAETLKAPVTEGQQIGVTRVFVDGNEVGTVKIVAKTEIEEITFGYFFKLLLKNIFSV